jgi:hypothetical protein
MIISLGCRNGSNSAPFQTVRNQLGAQQGRVIRGRGIILQFQKQTGLGGSGRGKALCGCKCIKDEVGLLYLLRQGCGRIGKQRFYEMSANGGFARAGLAPVTCQLLNETY